MKNYLDVHNEGVDLLAKVSFKIEQIAKSFGDVGNKEIAVKLFLFAREIQDGLDLVDESHNLLFNQYGDAIKEGNANMMSGILAMIQIANK